MYGQLHCLCVRACIYVLHPCLTMPSLICKGHWWNTSTWGNCNLVNAGGKRRCWVSRYVYVYITIYIRVRTLHLGWFCEQLIIFYSILIWCWFPNFSYFGVQTMLFPKDALSFHSFQQFIWMKMCTMKPSPSIHGDGWTVKIRLVSS